MKIFCSGIGGIGLSAYAALQNEAGHTVFGSDRTESDITRGLAGRGIFITTQQDGSAIPGDTNLFVYSEAIPADAPERRHAKQLQLKQQSYFQALGELSRDFTVIAVCGTHGKSSTTGMAAKVLIDAGVDPTVVVGTHVPDLGNRNWRRGQGDIFLLEACEYRRSFHFLSPRIVLMTNVDGDHFDAFTGVEEYQQAFVDFLRLLPDDGTVITHGSDADCRRVAHAGGRRVIDADTFPLPQLSLSGAHMRRNAQLVLALADELGMERESALRALHGYRGSARRLEYKGKWKGIPIYDDYAHHPVEIRATLAALKEAEPGKRIVCVFQPHMHDRTLRLYDDFIRAFDDAGVVVVPNVYDARPDVETERVDVGEFVHDIADQSHVEALDGSSLRQTASLLKQSVLQDGDVLLVMGAGDVTELASDMVQR